MASVKTMFRASSVNAKPGILYYQVIHNRVVRQLSTEYRIYPNEWDGKTLLRVADSPRSNYIKTISELIEWDLKLFGAVIEQIEASGRRYTADEIIMAFQRRAGSHSLVNFMQGVIAGLQRMGKQRTCETYRATLRSFMLFRETRMYFGVKWIQNSC